jgi:hypothetical protein
VGEADAARRYEETGRRLAAGLPPREPADVEALRACLGSDQAEGALDAAAGARALALARELLVDDGGGELRLLPGVPVEWLQAGTGVAVEGLPTRFGPISFRARLAEPTVLKVALTPPAMSPECVRISLPFEASGGSVEATDGWKAEIVDGASALRVTPQGRAGTATVRRK